MSEDFTTEERARMIEHMNDDHRDACLLYARHHLGVGAAQSASMADITREAMTLEVELDDGSNAMMTYAFERPLVSVADAAAYLAELAYRAGGS